MYLRKIDYINVFCKIPAPGMQQIKMKNDDICTLNYLNSLEKSHFFD